MTGEGGAGEGPYEPRPVDPGSRGRADGWQRPRLPCAARGLVIRREGERIAPHRKPGWLARRREKRKLHESAHRLLGSVLTD